LAQLQDNAAADNRIKNPDVMLAIRQTGCLIAAFPIPISRQYNILEEENSWPVKESNLKKIFFSPAAWASIMTWRWTASMPSTFRIEERVRASPSKS
jgi:hypothetical protein